MDRAERRRNDREAAGMKAFIEERLVPTIKREGWAVQAVGGGDDSVQFAYTVGLTPAGLPELLIYGLAFADATTVLNRLARAALQEDFDPEAAITEAASRPLKLVPTIDRPPVNMARTLYGEDAVTVLQVCWPDGEGRWQWDEGFDNPFGEIDLPYHGAPRADA